VLPAWPGPEEPDTPGETLHARTKDAAARTWWDAEADAYQAEHGAFLAGTSHVAANSANSAGASDHHVEHSSFVWGPEGRTEAELAVLGPVQHLAGRRVLEVGAGAAQCSAWLADQGARPVALDISINQLLHAQGERAPRVAGTATALPFGDSSFDAAFSAYGAVQFVADLGLLFAEVARVLRPGARWCFSVTHPVRWAFPDDPGELGLGVSGSYFDRTPYVERDGSGTEVYAEYHRTVGDYVTALVRAGFVLDALLEPEWPDWNEQTWGGWSPLRGWYLPGTLILGARLSA
jgi:SAM-dependent methyltransferase